MPNEFQYDVFLSHSSKDKAVVRASSLSASNGEGISRKGSRSEPLNRSSRRESALISPKFRWSGFTSAATREERIEEEHSKFGTRNSEFGLPRLCMSANAFGSHWAQLLTLSQPSTLNPQPTGAPLNQERRFISLRLDVSSPTRLDDAPIKGSLARCYSGSAGEFGLFRLRMLWHSTPRDLRTVARRMEGVARPDSAGAFSSQRRNIRAIPRDGRQP